VTRIILRRPGYGDLTHIAAHMRADDVREIMSASGRDPRASLAEASKTDCYIVEADGSPVIACGKRTVNVAAGIYSVWMLGVEGTEKYLREYLRHSWPVFRLITEGCRYLYNYVHVRNTTAVRYLKFMGFTLLKPVPYGIKGDMFYPFIMELEDV
jgi:hypothetical protein